MWRKIPVPSQHDFNFYSHIPCEMWRNNQINKRLWYSFLLTHPMWDVTHTHYFIPESKLDFYSHIPCEMWPHRQFLACSGLIFLLTHPMWDVTENAMALEDTFGFLLTHPMWDVTIIEIMNHPRKYNFYSHIPCEMWRILVYSTEWSNDFYSHIPCEMWRKNEAWFCTPLSISTHTSHVRCDGKTTWVNDVKNISTHTSHVRCDFIIFYNILINIKPFLLTHPMWDVTTFFFAPSTLFDFYSHIPCEMWPYFVKGKCIKY